MVFARSAPAELSDALEVVGASVAVVEATGARRLVAANSRFEAISGRPAAAIVGQPLLEVLPRYLVAELDGQIDRCVAEIRSVEHVAGERSVPERRWRVVLSPLVRGGLVVRVFATCIDITERDKTGELQHLATIDGLTGLANRRMMNEWLGHEITRARHFERSLSLVMLDLDRFERVIDTHGHLVGDRALVHVAAIVRGQVRSVDCVGRIGGEEFLILLPEATAGEAMVVAERTRTALCRAPLLLPGGEGVPLTASFGLAELAPHDTADSLVDAADSALHRATAEGRNRVAYRESGSGATDDTNDRHKRYPFEKLALLPTETHVTQEANDEPSTPKQAEDTK